MLVQARRFAAQAVLVARVYAGYKAIQTLGRLGVRDSTARLRRHHRRSAEAIYALATRLEGLPIKICQFLGSRADVLPDEFVEVLSRLQDRVPPRPLGHMLPVLHATWRRSVTAVCARFDPTPIAAASLAQVHRARLHDGREVAVKIQYPEIREIVTTDLQNFSVLVHALARIEPDFDMSVVLEEVRTLVPLELDFEHEARNATRMAALLGRRSDVWVPGVVPELSGPRVLVTEFAEGVRVTDVAGLRAFGLDPRAVAARLIDVFNEMVLVHGFFHGDPHPGNLLVQRDGRLVLLDFGLAKAFPPGFREGVVRLAGAILSQDRVATARAFRALGFRTRHEDDASLAVLGELFLGFAARTGRSYADGELIAHFNEQLPATMKANPVVEVPSDILLVGRVLGLLSGISKQLGSEVDVGAALMPYLVMGAGAPPPVATV